MQAAVATTHGERTGDDVRALRDLYAYNAWANAQVFAACRDLDEARLQVPAPGTFDSIAATLSHLVGVEDAYLYMLRGESPERMGPRDAYHAHDLPWFAARAAQLGGEYDALLAGADAAFYGLALDVPWFDFSLTRHDGLLQVLSHSAQHRAQVFSVLGQRGHEVPDLDYVLFVESKTAS